MAKDKTGNNNNVDGVVTSNKKIAESLREISNQSSVFEVLAAGVAKFREELEETSEVLSEQVEKLKAFDQLASSMDRSAKSAQQLGGAIGQQSKESKKAAEALGFKKSGSGYADNKNIFEELNKSSKAARIGINAMAGAMKVLSSVGKMVSGVISGVINVVSSVIDSIVTLGKGIFNFIVELYEGLFETAKEYRQGTAEYLREVENVREKFGNVAMGVGKAVVDMGKQIFKGGAAGLSGFALFEDKADALRKMSEMASAGGAAFELLIDQFRGKNLNDLYAFKEGLGLTNEEFAGMMKYSITVGRPVKSLMIEVQKYARGLTNEFGGTAKAFKSVSRDIIKARNDVRHFANVTIPDLARAAMYARKLGVELEKIVGVMDAFETFDAAAENVSKLSQAFGVNLDVMALTTASTPTDQIDMIKKSFDAAGRSVENMNRAELKYLAQTLHLDEATVQQVLSTKNQGEAMDKLKDSTKSMEHQMLSTAEALVDVMGEIKKVVRELAQITSKGFFGTFFEGFTEGIGQSVPFKRMMFSWADAINKVWHAGRELGLMFVKYFPGVTDILEGLAKIMPRISELFNKFGETLTNFFKQLESGQVDIGTLFDNMWKDMSEFFDSIDPQFGRGVSKFFDTISKIFQATLVFLIDKAGELIAALFEGIANYLDGKSGGVLDSAASAVSGGIGKAIKKGKDFSQPIVEAFGRAMDKIGPQFDRIWVHLKKGLDKFWSEYKWEILIGSLGPTIIGLFQTGLQIALTSDKARAAISKVVDWMGSKMSGMGMLLGGALGAAVAIHMSAAESRLKTVLSAAERRQMAADRADIDRRVAEAKAIADEGQRNQALAKLKDELRQAQLGAEEEVAKKYSGPFAGLVEDLGARKAAREQAEHYQKVLDGISTSSDAAATSQGKLDYAMQKIQEAGYKNLEEFEAAMQQSSTVLGSVGAKFQSFGELLAAPLLGTTYTEAWTKTAAEDSGAIDLAIEAYNKYRDSETNAVLKSQKEKDAELQSSVRDQAIKSAREAAAKGESLSGIDTRILAEGGGTVEGIAKLQTSEETAVQQKMLEEGRKAREQTLQLIGPTTIDNLEERFEKIKKIGEMVLGKKEPIEAQIKQIQETLESIDFTIMKPETETKFLQQLGTITSLESMLTKIKSMVATVGSIPDAFAGLGSAGEKGSIMYRFVDSMIAYGKAMHDIGTVFTGGILSDETEFVGRAEIGAEVMTAIDTYTKDVDKFSGAINQLKGAGEGFKNALDSLIPVMEAVAERRVKANEALASSFGVDPAAYASQKIKSDTGRVSEATAKMKSQVARAMSEVDGKVSVSLRDALEGRGQFTVRTEPLNLSVKITVGLDPTKLEGIILEQEKSIILETFNDLGGRVAPKTSYIVTPGVKPGTPSVKPLETKK